MRPQRRRAPVHGAGHEEEMPRVIAHAPAVVAFAMFMLSGVGFLYFVLPNIAGSARRVRQDRGRRRLVDRRSAWCSRCCSFAGYIVLFRVCVRPRPRAHRLARELRDHDGGTRGHAPVRRRRRRRHRAHRVGAARARGWSASRGVPDGRVPGAAVRRVRRSLLIDGIGLGEGLFPGGGSFAITVVPASSAAVLIARSARSR